jgi:hypothetical protein
MLDDLRRQLELPIARIKLAVDATDYLAGEWEVKLPLAHMGATVNMKFGEQFEPSWRASLELPEFSQEERPSEIFVNIADNAALVRFSFLSFLLLLLLMSSLLRQLDRPIDGTYKLEAKCGTATSSLYRRISPVEGDSKPLFFFFDPSAFLQNKHDAFVFADTCARTETARVLVAALEPSWRLPGKIKDGQDPDYKSPTILLSQVWFPLEGSKIVPGAIEVGEASQFSTIQTGFELVGGEDDCRQAEDLLVAKVPLASSPSEVWAKSTWHEVDLQHEGVEVFNKLAWMVCRIPEWQNLKEWQSVKSEVRFFPVCISPL